MDLPKRKHPRLKCYDYSQTGYYFVTIQTKPACPSLSTVGRGLAPAGLVLSAHGKIVEDQLLALEIRFPNVKIDRYVIMPNHIHAILVLSDTEGASPRPTLSAVVGAWKSLTARLCNQRDQTPGRVIFQASFHDRVLRNEAGYLAVCKYMEENPAKWLESGKEPDFCV